MRVDDARLDEALGWSVSRDLIVDVYHGTDRVLADARFTDYSLVWNLEATVKGSGSGTIVHQSEKGESILPSGVNGVLSPFRARVVLSMLVSAGGYERRVQLGWFRVMSAPSGSDQLAMVNGRSVVVSSTVRVELQTLDADVQAFGFHQDEQPPQTGSAFAELRRIGLLPFRETVDDFALPSGFTWEAKSGGRLDAVNSIAAAGGYFPVVDSRGMWVLVRRNRVGEDPDLRLRVGEFGSVVDYGEFVDTDGIYNEVVGEFEAEDGSPIRSVRSVTSGPLAVDGAWMRKTLYWSSPVIKTQAAADAAVASRLANVSGSQLYDVPVTCLINPVVEIGDVVLVQDDDDNFVIAGQVVRQELTDGDVMGLTLRMRRFL